MLDFTMTKNIKTNLNWLTVLFVALFAVSCSFSAKPVDNNKEISNKETKNADVKDVKNRDDLKVKAIETVKLVHKLLEERKFEEVYQMIDDNSALKLPKAEAMGNIQEVADTLGKVEKMDLTKDNVVEDSGQLQVRQEFIVKFEKDTPTPSRYENFIWNVYPDNNLKLWKYLNAKSED